MQAFEVGHFRLVPRFDQDVKGRFHQRTDSSTEYHLFTKQVGLGLLFKARFDNSTPGTANSLGVSESQLLRLLAGSFTHRDQSRNSTPLFILAANQVPRTLGGDQQGVHVGRRCHLAIVDIESVRAHQDIARFEVIPDLADVEVGLDFIW